MRYERPAIEQRVKTTGPVIVGGAGPVSPPVPTPNWAPHDTTNITADDTGRETS